MKLLRSCKLNILQWRINPKYAFVAMYMVLYMWYETQGFVAYSRALGYPVRPWLFPLLPGDPGNFVPIFLAFVLLVSDAPFRNRQQQFVLLRVGKGAWIGGQLMYILFTSVVFTAALWLLSWIFLLPNLAWGNDWGPVLTTTAVAGGAVGLQRPLDPVLWLYDQRHAPGGDLVGGGGHDCGVLPLGGDHGGVQPVGPEGRRGGGGIRLFHSAPGDQRFCLRTAPHQAASLDFSRLLAGPEPHGKQPSKFAVLHLWGADAHWAWHRPGTAHHWHHSPVQSGYTGRVRTWKTPLKSFM